MTENKAQTLLTDWAMSLIEPDHIPVSTEVNVLAGEANYSGKHAYRSDIPLYKGGKTLLDYRSDISRLLENELTKTQLEATFLYFATPKNSFSKVGRALDCSIDVVSRAVKKAINLLKVKLI